MQNETTDAEIRLQIASRREIAGRKPNRARMNAVRMRIWKLWPLIDRVKMWTVENGYVDRRSELRSRRTLELGQFGTIR
jgi:hypothetical protein